MTAQHDLSGAFRWATPEDIRQINAVAAERELHAEWVREHARRKRAKRDYLAWVSALLGLFFVGLAMWLGARGGA